MLYPGSPCTMVVRHQPKQLDETQVRDMCAQFTDLPTAVAAAQDLPLATLWPAHR
ncbi:hypothetical protein [Streptomyces sp. NPDC050548]|uniref:hypothetical protein n=1 Tax=Streptomyces sp. NPDC050548 TaxID=3365629 RepID=UPI0037AE562B